MDRRYFHGIRTSAAKALGILAKEENGWADLQHLERVFEELFCIPGTVMAQPNDFSDRSFFNIQCAIVRSMGNIRDHHNRAPFGARKFLYEKLRYNDNSVNEVSKLSCLKGLLADNYSFPIVTMFKSLLKR